MHRKNVLTQKMSRIRSASDDFFIGFVLEDPIYGSYIVIDTMLLINSIVIDLL